MRVAIMQPTYLPWLGYFNLIRNVDCFVFLDDVSFDHRSWQHRNRIILDDVLTWLTVPVFSKGKRCQLIGNVLINNEVAWRRKHLGTLAASFSHSLYRENVMSIVRDQFGRTFDLLADLNISFIVSISSLLNLKARFIRSSELQCEGVRSQRLLHICNMLGATTYISPAGSREYIEADGVFEADSFSVLYQAFKVPQYREASPLVHGEFPSILDSLAWIGTDATRLLIDPEIT